MNAVLISYLNFVTNSKVLLAISKSDFVLHSGGET